MLFRSIKAVEEKELAGLISLKGKNPAAIDQGFDDFIRRVRETRDIQRSRAEEFDGTASDIGFAEGSAGGVAAESASLPATNSKGWTLQVDAAGNKAYVSPDKKQFEEVK